MLLCVGECNLIPVDASVFCVLTLHVAYTYCWECGCVSVCNCLYCFLLVLVSVSMPVKVCAYLLVYVPCVGDKNASEFKYY